MVRKNTISNKSSLGNSIGKITNEEYLLEMENLTTKETAALEKWQDCASKTRDSYSSGCELLYQNLSKILNDKLALTNNQYRNHGGKKSRMTRKKRL